MRYRFAVRLLVCAAVVTGPLSLTPIASAGPVDLGSSGSAGPGSLDPAGVIGGVTSAVVDPVAAFLARFGMGSSGPVAPANIAGKWSGTWTIPAGTYSGTLDVGSIAPVTATIDIPTRPCTATWTEIARAANTVTVAADVINGSCEDNVWVLNVSENRITGYDSNNREASVDFVRR